ARLIGQPDLNVVQAEPGGGVAERTAVKQPSVGPAECHAEYVSARTRAGAPMYGEAVSVGGELRLRGRPVQWREIERPPVGRHLVHQQKVRGERGGHRGYGAPYHGTEEHTEAEAKHYPANERQRVQAEQASLYPAVLTADAMTEGLPPSVLKAEPAGDNGQQDHGRHNGRGKPRRATGALDPGEPGRAGLEFPRGKRRSEEQLG